MMNRFLEENDVGVAGDSRGGFMLSPSKRYIPDCWFFTHERWQNEFDQGAWVEEPPDLIIELMSDTDVLENAIQKMKDWRDFGVREGILIDPNNRRTYRFRQGKKRWSTDDNTYNSAVVHGLSIDVRLIYDM